MPEKKAAAIEVSLLPPDNIVSQIFLVRGQRVMLAQSLAVLYEVEPRVLIQAVKRNLSRFPDDFMFQLAADEFENLKSQFVISSWGGSRVLPYAFTEQGVAMLSGVLRSERAIAVNIEIMRAFVQLRSLLESSRELASKLADMEKKYDIPCEATIFEFSRVSRDAMQGANCAVWLFHTSNLQRSSAPARRWINTQIVALQGIKFGVVFDAIKQLMNPPMPAKKQRIGFVQD